jgi:hypothetical protein
MPAIPLQRYVETHGCKYFAENECSDGEVLNLALHSPFTRLYAASRSIQNLEVQQSRFSDNERVQLFLKTHQGCWSELVRLVPIDQPAAFWMHPTENVMHDLIVLGRLRPQRQDLILFEVGSLRGVLKAAERHFSRTHVIRKFVEDITRKNYASISLGKIEEPVDPTWIMSPLYRR